MSSDDKVKKVYGESHPDGLKMNISGVLDNSVDNQNKTDDNENQNNDKVYEAENDSDDKNDDKVEKNSKQPYPVTVIKGFHTYNKSAQMFDGKSYGNENTSGVDPETKKDQTTQENPEKMNSEASVN